MAATISVAFASQVSITETLTGTYVSTSANNFVVNGLNESTTYTASTSVPVTKCAAFQQALTSGAATIDLTALPGATADETVVGTGLKLQILKIRNLSTNANKITVSNGASNPYRLDGATTAWTFVLAPGQSYTLFLNESADDVGSSHKTIDLAGTGSQVLEVLAVLG